MTAVAFALFTAIPPLQSQTPSPKTQQKKPRLVLMIAVDQFRYDYLTRFRSEYKGGLDRLLRNGANHVNANLEHYPTVTAIGHSTMMSGATPQTSGIVGNEWWDRDARKEVTSVSDETTQLLGGTPGAGSSPRRLMVSTVGDEMKRSGRDKPKVVGISMKDRSAILPSGHMADAAYWYDSKTGDFISSTYYFQQLPEWVQAFNQRRLADKYAGVEWRFDQKSPDGAVKMPDIGPKLSAAIYSSPFGNEMVEQFAEEAIQKEKLGQRDATDLLTVSFSSNDAVGHSYGPDSPRAHDMCLRTDRDLGKLFAYLDRTVGMQNVIVALTADHGVDPLPEQLQQDHMPGGRIPTDAILTPLRQALKERFGAGEFIEHVSYATPYFNWKLVDEKKIDRAEFQRFAASIVERAPHVSRVFTRDQLLKGEVSFDKFSERVVRSFNQRRSGDLELLLDPYWIHSKSGTTHGTPYGYDTHIPLIFMGPGIKPGRYVRPAALNDLAPSLATILDVEIPSGSVGRPLWEMMVGVMDH
ncbi:alkaline phosphatase family protein [Bryobacter aggregatus]|uniref:alkaline phosphatase family protein n=1 Tax=Bryobacter aggregatus TaxID=360054 RepID=UPI00138E0E27|nr:alkaline phosphatase family protein [Bryobacter aggregatus]